MATAVLTIDAQTRDAVREIEKFQGSASRSLAAVETSFKTLGAIAGAAIAAVGFSKLVSGLNTAVEAAKRQEDAVNSLNTALKISGEFSDAASKDLQAFASSLQATSKFGDEAVLEQLALAKAFGATNEQAKLVVSAAAELAAATGKNLNETTRQVAKTLGGLAGELGEVNPAIKALTAEQLKAGEAAKVLVAQFGGSAISQIKTFSGASTQLGNSYGDFLEKIGDIVIKSPALIKAINIASEAFNSLGEFLASNQDSLNGFVDSITIGLIEAASIAVKSIRSIVTVLSVFYDALEAIINFIPGLTRSLNFLFKVAGDIASAFTGLFTSVNKVLGIVSKKKTQNNVFDDFNASLNKTSDFLDQAVVDVRQSTRKIDTSFKDSSDRVVAGFDREAAARKATAEKAVKDTIAAFEKLEGEFKNFGRTEIEGVENVEKERLDIINRALKDRLISEERAARLRENVQRDSGNKIAEIIKKQDQEVARQKEEAAKRADEVAIIKRGTVETVEQGLGPAAGSAVGAVAGAINPLGAIVSAVEGLTGIVKKVLDFLPNLINAIADIFNSITELPKKLLESVQNLFKSITDFISNIISNIIRSVAGLIKSAVQFVFRDLPKAFIEAFRSLGPTLKEVLPDLVNTITSLAENFGPLVEKIVEALIDAIPAIIISLVDTLIIKGGIFRIAFAFVKAFYTFIPSLTAGLVKGIGGAIQDAIPGIGDAFSRNIKFPEIKFPEIDWSELREIFSGRALLDGLIQFFQRIPEFFSRAFSFIDFGNIGRMIGNAFSSIIKLPSINISGLTNLFQTPPFLKKLQSLFDLPPFLKKLQAIFDNFNPGKAFGGGGGGIGGAIGKVGGSIGKALGFAEGGLVPAGFPNDTFPARLTSGEAVIDRTDNERLSRFLDRQESQRSQRLPDQNVTINLRVGESDLAKVLLNLNRQGFRTA